MSIRQVTFSIIKEIIQTALISAGIFFFVYIFLVQPHKIKGASMFPNLRDSELLLTEKVYYYIQKPKRGDVIVFQAPNSNNVDFIKRIIAQPRDTIKIENGIIYVNNQKLDEPYETQDTQGDLNVKIADNQYFVLGDNRSASSDSRSFGTIDRKSIKGKAWLIYWPIVKSNNFPGARFISGVDYGIPDSFEDY